MAKIFAVINPKAGKGRLLKSWESIETHIYETLGAFDYRFTRHPLEATRLTQKALQSGFDWIFAIGGDGTVNEVINGFFQKEKAINPKARLSILTSGTGSDLTRSLQLDPNIFEQINALKQKRSMAIYIGDARFSDQNGVVKQRYFINVASFGLSSKIAAKINDSLRAKYFRPFGAKALFYIISALELLGYKDVKVTLKSDKQVLNQSIKLAAVANAKFFGGGMQIAPKADLQQPNFSLVIVNRLKFWEFIYYKKHLYRGTHLNFDFITDLYTSRLEASSETEVALELDGEVCGMLPARFSLSPETLHLYY